MKRTLTVAFIAIGLCVQLFAGPKHTRAMPQRLASVSQNGTNVTLHFQDGTSMDVAAANVKVRKKSHAVSIAQLSAMTGELPAVAIVSEGAHGRHARIRVFETDEQTRAFLQTASDRRAAKEARTSKQ